MSERRKLAKDQFVEEIADLCKAGESGTIFIVTSKNHQAKIILREGKIIAAFLRPLSGVDVISALAREPEVSFAFNNSLLLEVNSQVLPDTASLLDFLKNSSGSIPGFVTPEDITGAHDLNEIRRTLVDEATEYLGPMAGPICDEYLAQYKSSLARQDILHIIELLQNDINDPEKSDKFNEAVRKQLGFD